MRTALDDALRAAEVFESRRLVLVVRYVDEPIALLEVPRASRGRPHPPLNSAEELMPGGARENEPGKKRGKPNVDQSDGQ
jgi:hypothetical protein